MKNDGNGFWQEACDDNVWRGCFYAAVSLLAGVACWAVVMTIKLW